MYLCLVSHSLASFRHPSRPVNPKYIRAILRILLFLIFVRAFPLMLWLLICVDPSGYVLSPVKDSGELLVLA